MDQTYIKQHNYLHSWSPVKGSRQSLENKQQKYPELPYQMDTVSLEITF